LNDDNDFLNHWDEERKKGKLKYVLNENKVFLFIKFPIILITAFLIGGIAQIYTGFTILTSNTIIKTLIISSPTWITPISFTLKKWKKNEKRYIEIKH
jgi:hypothetical protein